MSFTEEFYKIMIAEYKADPKNSQLYSIKEAELEEQSGKQKQRYALYAECFIAIKEAYKKAGKAYERDAADLKKNRRQVTDYLKLVLEFLQYKGKKQIFIPRDKDELRKFCERWNRYLMAFHKDDEFVLDDVDLTTVAKVCERIGSIPDECICIGRDAESEKEILDLMQNELKDSCIRKAVESYILDKRNFELRTIDRQLLDRCAGNKWFSRLFSKDSDEKETDEMIAKDAAMFFEIIEKCTDDVLPGSEEYRNIFIPLYVDRYTGVSLCIVGRNYCISQSAGCFPCGLVVLSAEDSALKTDSDISVCFVAREPFGSDPALMKFAQKYKKAGSDTDARRKACDDYFFRLYDRYRMAVLKAKYLFEKINIRGLSEIPEKLNESALFMELQRPREEWSVMDMKETDDILADIGMEFIESRRRAAEERKKVIKKTGK